MKKGIIVSSVVLSNAFKEAGKVKPYSGIPCTESFLLECSPETVYLVRSNLEDTVKVELGCECNFTGAFLLEASIGKLMAKIEEQPVSINIIDEDVETVYVCGDDFETKIVTDHPDDYISHEKDNFKEIGSMGYDEFRAILERLVPFLSKDGLRPAMTGFCFDATNVTATNGNMLRTIPYCGFDVPDKDEIIVRNIFPYLPKLKVSSNVILSVSDKNVKIEFCGHVIYSRLINENYPNYQAVIPRDFVTEFSVGNGSFKKVIEQAMIFANKSTNQINIDVTDKVVIDSEDFDFGNEFSKTMEYKSMSGRHMKFAVNGKIFLECLKYLGDDVNFQLAGTNKGMMLNSEVFLMPIAIS